MSKKTTQTRKQFLKKIGAGTLALASTPAIIGAGTRPHISYLSRKKYSANINMLWSELSVKNTDKLGSSKPRQN